MDNNASACVKTFWYHGFSYNATLASRAQITTVITEGMFFCLDIEAHEDINVSGGTPPTGTDYGTMNIKPEPNAGSGTSTGNAAFALSKIVTKPYTNSLSGFAGVVAGRTNARKWGSQSYGAGPQYLELATHGPVVMCRLNGTFSKYTEIMLANDSFFGVPWAAVDVTSTVNQTTVNAALASVRSQHQKTVGTCLLAGTYDGSQLVPCRIYNLSGES
jgi:hypothetical protein